MGLEHRNHAWDEVINVHAHLGLPGEVRCWDVFAPDPLAVAITGHLCSLSIRHKPGEKFRVGPKWWARMRENAEGIERQSLEADGE